MKNEIKPKSILSNQKIAIVVSSWNDAITSLLLTGATACFEQQGGDLKNLTVVWAPGCVEIPIICQKLALTKKYQGITTLGVVIQGDTDHHHHVTSLCSNGISKITLENQIPIAFGILTTKNLEQAQHRAGVKYGNKGYEAMHSLIQSLSVLEQIK